MPENVQGQNARKRKTGQNARGQNARRQNDK